MSIKCDEIVDSPAHKTVIVIDRSKSFCTKASEQSGLFRSSDENTYLKLSRWACAIQGVYEFHRLLSDLFPHGTRQIRICVSDIAARFITPAWQDELVTYQELTHAFYENQPDANASSASSSITTGLNICMDALTAPTKLQSKFLEMSAGKQLFYDNFNGTRMPKNCPQNANENHRKFYGRLKIVRSNVQKNAFLSNRITEINNSGSIIVFTSVVNLEKLKEIVTFVKDQIYERNELYKTVAGQTDSILPLAKVSLSIIHISGENEPKLNDAFSVECNEYCKSRRGLVKPSIYFATNSASLTKVIHNVLCSNYDISSTTVTDIPMKEESDPSKSQSYDVELFHHKRIHNFFQTHKLLDPNSPIASRNDLITTAKLKWSSVNNKFNKDEPPMFTYTSLATLANVRNRPSKCLCDFLMRGKNVLLDVNSKTPLPMITQNFAGTTISNVCSTDLNDGAMIIKCLSFDLSNKYKLLPKPKPKNLDYNSYKNVLVMQRVEPVPTGNTLVYENPRPIFYSSSRIEQLSVARPIRSESPAAKRLRTKNWVTNETINLFEYVNRKQERAWDNWRDFEGRRINPDTPVVLYPNLQTTERLSEPVGGVRPTKPRRGRQI